MIWACSSRKKIVRWMEERKKKTCAPPRDGCRRYGYPRRSHCCRLRIRDELVLPFLLKRERERKRKKVLTNSLSCWTGSARWPSTYLLALRIHSIIDSGPLFKHQTDGFWWWASEKHAALLKYYTRRHYCYRYI